MLEATWFLWQTIRNLCHIAVRTMLHVALVRKCTSMSSLDLFLRRTTMSKSRWLLDAYRSADVEPQQTHFMRTRVSTPKPDCGELRTPCWVRSWAGAGDFCYRAWPYRSSQPIGLLIGTQHGFVTCEHIIVGFDDLWWSVWNGLILSKVFLYYCMLSLMCPWERAPPLCLTDPMPTTSSQQAHHRLSSEIHKLTPSDMSSQKAWAIVAGVGPGTLVQLHPHWLQV